MSKSFHSIVVLTGAGISAESGIRTFRAADGLWEEHHIEDVASPEGFVRNPELVHRFYNARRNNLLQPDITPNAAHRALAEFEAGWDGDFLLVTQNIDDLHERAGSQHLIHMHGELLKIRCANSNQIFSWSEESLTTSICQCCEQTGNLRPHVVWFGEMPLEMDAIYNRLEQCDLFIAIGTSGNVYPAAGFFQVAKSAGAETVELNLESSISGSHFDQQIFGPATETVPSFLASLTPEKTV